MKQPLLNIQSLAVSVGDKQILNSVDLVIHKGETHVLMGPNGTGKSTLVSAIMGDPRYTVDGGSIEFEGKNLVEESTDERARRGIFLSFQAPEEIPGITLENFLRTAVGALEGKPPRVIAFQKRLREQMAALDMDEAYASRYLNVGFSGGEKKKAEILQLLMLHPKLAMLDETDSGLDVDAVRTVSKGIHAYHNEENAILIITHNAKILEDLEVDYVHVLGSGRIVRTGGRELADEILQTGFAGLQGEGEPLNNEKL